MTVLRSYRFDESEWFDRDEDIKAINKNNREETIDSDSSDSFFDDSHLKKFKDYPDQILEDLSNFKLAPPSSLSEVRKARNQESKKYHPDRFMDDTERQETAKEIMQIYNESYSRLKKFFQNRSH
ncbi:MAG: hypothetical protein C0403_09280 [Desulfobacterium sp.]|nr:hypothetical protein [Desulfobacterium sp.]